MRNYLIPCLMLFTISTSLASEQIISQSHQNEKVTLKIPETWKLGYQGQTPNMSIYEYIPQNESVQKWENMITVQIFPGLTRDTNALQFLAKVTELVKQSCKEGATVALYEPNKNRPDLAHSAMAFTSCAKYKTPEGIDVGEITAFLAMEGQSALFLVQRAWRGQPFDPKNPPYSEEMNQTWSLFFKEVNLSSK